MIWLMFTVNVMARNEQIVPGGARPLGMGGAYAGISDDVNTIGINPAGLSSIKNTEVMLMGSPVVTGLDEGSLFRFAFQGVMPLSVIGGLGLKLDRFMAGYEGETLYSETEFDLGYSHYLFQIIHIGFALKGHMWEAKGEEFLNLKDPATGGDFYSMSAGLLYPINDRFKLGMSVDHLYTISTFLKSGYEDESIPAVFRMGMGLNFKHYLIGLDLEYNHYNVNIGTGAEVEIIDDLFIRGGLNLRDFFYGADITFGAGYTFNHYQIDYGLSYPLFLGTFGTHRISANYRFDFNPFQSLGGGAGSTVDREILKESQQKFDTLIAFGKKGQFSIIQHFQPGAEQLSKIVLKPGPNKGNPENNIVIKILKMDKSGFPEGDPLITHTVKGSDWNDSFQKDLQVPLNTKLDKNATYGLIIDVDAYMDKDVRSISAVKKDTYAGHLTIVKSENDQFENKEVDRDLYFKNYYKIAADIGLDGNIKIIEEEMKGDENWEEKIVSSIVFGGTGGVYKAAQQFVAQGDVLTKVSVRPGPDMGRPKSDVIISIYKGNEDDGTPEGQVLFTQKILSKKWSQMKRNELMMSMELEIEKDEIYCIVIEAEKYDDEGNTRKLGGSSDDMYEDGDILLLRAPEQEWAIGGGDIHFRTFFRIKKKIRVDPFKINFDKSQSKKIFQDVFGVATGLVGPSVNVLDKSYQDLINQIQPALLRYPGGNGANTFDLNTGLVMNKKKLIESGWSPSHDKVTGVDKRNAYIKVFYPDENYTADLFNRFCKKVNGKPSWVVNIVDDPQDVKKWLLGLKAKGIPAEIFELGNELFFAQWKDICENAEDYIEMCKEQTKVIKQVFPEARVGVVVESAWRTYSALDDRNMNDGEWNDALANEDFYDAVIIHLYSRYDEIGSEDDSSVDEIRRWAFARSGPLLEPCVEDFKRKYEDKEIWITEWNLNQSQVRGVIKRTAPETLNYWNPEHTQLAALFVCDKMLNFMRYPEITVANYWVLTDGGVFGLMNNYQIKPDNPKRIMKIKSEFYAFKILKDAIRNSDEVIHADINGVMYFKAPNMYSTIEVDGITAVAFLKNGKANYLAFVNKTGKIFQLKDKIFINNDVVNGKVKVNTLTADELLPGWNDKNNPPLKKWTPKVDLKEFVKDLKDLELLPYSITVISLNSL
jgi:hypothetical protein